MSKAVVKQRMVIKGSYEHRNKNGKLISRGKISFPNENFLKRIFNFILGR